VWPNDVVKELVGNLSEEDFASSLFEMAYNRRRTLPPFERHSRKEPGLGSLTSRTLANRLAAHESHFIRLVVKNLGVSSPKHSVMGTRVGRKFSHFSEGAWMTGISRLMLGIATRKLASRVAV